MRSPSLVVVVVAAWTLLLLVCYTSANHLSVYSRETCVTLDGGGDAGGTRAACFGDVSSVFAPLSGLIAYSPRFVPKLEGQVNETVVGGSHTLFLMKDGSVRCAGDNSLGACGLAKAVVSVSPPATVTSLLSEVIQVAAGTDHSVFLLHGGVVKVVGGNEYGALGLGDAKPRYHVVDANLTGIPGTVTRVAAGHLRTIVINSGGELFTAGWNVFGTLGLPDNQSRRHLTHIASVNGPAADVAIGWTHTLVLLSNGTILAFGVNDFGQLGVGDTASRLTPVTIHGIPGKAKRVAASVFHSAAVLIDGRLLMWGGGAYLKLGDGNRTDHLVPTLVDVGGPVAEVALGQEHSVVLLENGDLKTVGWNKFGQLGIGSHVAKARGVPQFVLNVNTFGIDCETSARKQDESTCLATSWCHFLKKSEPPFLKPSSHLKTQCKSDLGCHAPCDYKCLALCRLDQGCKVVVNQGNKKRTCAVAVQP